MRVVIAFLCLAAVMFSISPVSALPIVIADLADDYLGGTEDQTTTDVGLTGTMGGSWNYYQDADGVIDDNSAALLAFTVDGISDSDPGPGFGVGNGAEGYDGTDSLFGIPLPAITPTQIFNDDSIATPAQAGFLQMHPGTVDSNPYVAVEYRADSSLTNLVLEYELAIGSIVNFPDTEGNISYSILEVVGGTASTLVGPTTLFDAAPTGALSVSVSDLSAGDSVWLLINPGTDPMGMGGDPFGDATNVRLTLTQVPEPASLLLLGVAVGMVCTFRPRR